MKAGDLVEILVGQQIWTADGRIIDIRRELVGQKAIIEYSYADRYGGNNTDNFCIRLKDNGASTAWFNIRHLKKIKQSNMKDGYYWVRNGPVWTIAQYSDGWWVMGSEIQHEDSDFDSFYPIPIELPDILKEKDED